MTKHMSFETTTTARVKGLPFSDETAEYAEAWFHERLPDSCRSEISDICRGDSDLQNLVENAEKYRTADYRRSFHGRMYEMEVDAFASAELLTTEGTPVVYLSLKVTTRDSGTVQVLH